MKTPHMMGGSAVYRAPGVAKSRWYSNIAYYIFIYFQLAAFGFVLPARALRLLIIRDSTTEQLV